jgi:multiple antibiotic resistance protein
MLDIALSAFVTLFVMIDPIGLAPIFVALTARMDPAGRRRIGLRGVAVAFGILAVFGLFGEQILTLIGITLPAFRISGGLMLFLIALDMLFESRSARREKNAEAPDDDPSVFPLATPLLAGPGAMAAMILLIGAHPGDAAAQAVIIAVMACVLLICLALFAAGGLIERLLGPTGVRVVTRLLGVLLGALAVQFVLDGVRALGVV